MQNNIKIDHLNRCESESDFEISLTDAINFIQDHWKRLALAAFIGASLGFASWIFLGNYTSYYVLLSKNSNSKINTNINSNNTNSSNTNSNNTNSNTNTNTNTNTNSINNTTNTNSSNTNNSTNSNYALDLVSWKTIQKSLPNLVAQIRHEGDVPEGQDELFKILENEEWWQKNVIASYAISKADTKEFATTNKDLDAASTTILSLTVAATGTTKVKSIENVRAVAKFLRTGGAYLKLRSILTSYEIDAILAVADIQQRITSIEIEMGYQVQRVKKLEELHKLFPAGYNIGNQVVDPKESGAKYLPLSTQIIAANNEINQSKEGLQRLRDRLLQLSLIKTFLEQAVPVAEKIFDGIILADELLAIEANMRNNITKEDVQQREVLDQLRSQLLSVRSFFTKSLESNAEPVTTKKGMIKSVVSGLAGAFFLMLFFLIVRPLWENSRRGVTKNRPEKGVLI